MNHKPFLPDLTHLYYRPRAGESLFHYCSEKAFWRIFTSQTLWLSSVWAMNDREELWWGRKATGLVLANHAREFPPEFREFILSSLASPDLHVLPLVTSFSRNGDLLSQWRAYAEVTTRDKDGQEVPYIALPFPNRSVVSGIILGPKNPLSTDDVQHKLSKLGFQGASVRRSSSPYR